MRILPLILRWLISITVVETARTVALRWLLGEISLQDLWDRSWRKSAAKHEDSRRRHDDGEETPRSETKAD